MPLLAELYAAGTAEGLLLQTGNNSGYFGPYEALLRGSGTEAVHWTGCFAGRNVLGIEADGTVKGCPSLPTTAYAGGNVRDTSIAEIWASASQLSFARNCRRQEMWGWCAGCYSGRLHLDVAFPARAAGQQPLLPLPGVGAEEAGQTRAGGPPASRIRNVLRPRPVRHRGGTRPGRRPGPSSGSSPCRRSPRRHRTMAIRTCRRSCCAADATATCSLARSGARTAGGTSRHAGASTTSHWPMPARPRRGSRTSCEASTSLAPRECEVPGHRRRADRIRMR
ncbi:SPASM domain-containing protein [Streptomyces sp. NPDC058755]|uniref:SPASM domain-containing protein n=1 Tax=Streptomyces sp. NPDC058755 TaxID=3346624 RepID=UPI003681A7B6